MYYMKSKRIKTVTLQTQKGRSAWTRLIGFPLTKSTLVRSDRNSKLRLGIKITLF